MKLLKLLELKLSNINLMTFMIFILAFWSILIQDGQVNRDGLLYIKQTYIFSEVGWYEGFKFFNWPFFSLIILFFSKLTNLSFQYSAHLTDLILFFISANFYLKILFLIYKDKKIIFYGGLLLLSYIPLMDDYVPMILRDHGFWAGSMMGVYYYIIYLEKSTFKNNLLWQLSFLLGGLFRPESFIFLITIPIAKLVIDRYEKEKSISLKDLLKEYSLVLLSFICIFFYLYHDFNNHVLLGRLNEFIPKLTVFVSQLFNPLPFNSTNKFLDEIINKNSFLITLSVLAVVVISKWLVSIGFFRFLLLISYFKTKEVYIKKRKIRFIVYFLIFLNIFLPTINFFNAFVFSNRYLESQWYLLFILISPVLMKFFYLKNNRNILLMKSLVGLYIVCSILVSMIDIKKDDDIEIVAGKYIANLNISENVSILNADRVAYYGEIDLKYIAKPILFDSNPEWIIYYGHEQYNNKLNNMGYSTVKSFFKKDRKIGVFILKRNV